MLERTKIFSPVTFSWAVSLLAVVTIATGVQAHAMLYFVAVDNAPTVTFGPYQGLANPNQGRLTFLFAHTNEENPSDSHFHGIGAYSYAGPLENPHIVPTNSNNRIPEGFSEEPPLRLFPGRAKSLLALLNPKQYGGFRFIGKPYESEYSELTVSSVQSLSTFPADSPEGYLFQSSGGQWTSPLSDAVIAVELVAISEGLHISDRTGFQILHNVGDRYVLGEGNSFHFLPTFWADIQAPAGTYSVTLKLVDVGKHSSPLAESGTFTLDFIIPATPTYFVAVDTQPVFPSGTYQGLANPNHGRLTFLFAHTSEENPASSHFHGIGAYSYTGAVESPIVESTNTNNRIPEGFSEEPPLRLSPGTGVFAFHLVNKPGESEYSRLTIESIQSLSPFPPDAPEGYLFSSSGRRWSTPLSGAVIVLELVSISEGLHIADEAGEEILHQVGDVYVLGEGNSFSFTPIFWTDGRAAAGTYSATLRLIEVSETAEPLLESGTFTLDFQVPEPIVGTDGDDVIVGTPGDDVIFGGGGNDIIMGEGGNDLIYGVPGDDTILGGPGGDAIDGGPGADLIFGEDGDDTIRTDGLDTIFGGPGNNTIIEAPEDGSE